MALSKLEKLLGAGAAAVACTELLFFRNTAHYLSSGGSAGIYQHIDLARNPLIYSKYITPYIGNFPESFMAPLFSGLIGDCIEHIGKIKGIRIVEKLGKYFPELALTAITTYFTLGETILPQILGGTPDPKDVPAVFLSAAAGCLLAKLGRKSGFNSAFHSLTRQTMAEIKEEFNQSS